MVLLQLSETCLIFTVKTLAASSFLVPNKTSALFPTHTTSGCNSLVSAAWLYIPFIVFSHFRGVNRTASSFGAVLEFWGSCVFPMKMQTCRLLCFQEILQRGGGTTVIAGSPQEDSSCRTEGGECGAASFEVPKYDQGFLLWGKHDYVKE